MGRLILDRLLENERLFERMKILVIGDVALDRTFRCSMAEAGTHATHGGETIYDILDGGDDYGTVGASNNSLVFSRSLSVRTALVAAVGSDPEGDRVEQVLQEAGEHLLLLRLDGIRTVTRLRYLIWNPRSKRHEFLFRFDKDPDIPLSYRKAEERIREDDFLDRFESEATASDVIFFNDTDKGFLSRGVLTSLHERIERAAAARSSKGLKRPLIMVDPKVEWEKYKGLHIDILKPNYVEACKALGLPPLDVGDASNLRMLAERFESRYGDVFGHLVVTLGPLGAMVLNRSGATADLTLHPDVPPRESPSGVATHCGDMFATALGLSFSLTDDLPAAIDFANYVGSLQFSKNTGEKISRSDLTASSNVAHCRAHYQEPKIISALKTG